MLWIYKERFPLFFTFFTNFLVIGGCIILYEIQDHLFTYEQSLLDISVGSIVKEHFYYTHFSGR